jgi:hypothetical protein
MPLNNRWTCNKKYIQKVVTSINGTKSLSFHSSPSLNLMSNETSGPSSVYVVTSTPTFTNTLMESPMNKYEMLQSLSESLALIINKFKTRVLDQDALLFKEKVNVKLKKEKNAFKIGKLKAT